jgi:hypothetical protein
VTAALAAPGAEFATDKAGIVGSYRVMVPAEDFETTKRKDEADKPRAMERQRTCSSLGTTWPTGPLRCRGSIHDIAQP